MSKRIAVIVKSFLREECMERLVSSLEEHLAVEYRLYIADEEPVPPVKRKLYERLQSFGHYIRVFQSESRISVTHARNELIKCLEDEEYVLRVDDDFVLTHETDVDLMRRILMHRPEIGAIAGVEIQGRLGNRSRAGGISPGQGFVYFDRKRKALLKQLIPVEAWPWIEFAGRRFAYADFTRNFLLIRRKVFETVAWNEELQIQGEHLDFMLRLKKHGWALAFTPDSKHHHIDPPRTRTSISYRQARESTGGEERFRNVYRTCWGVDKVSVVQGGDPLFIQRASNFVRHLIKTVLIR